jgi:hypothetical protein
MNYELLINAKAIAKDSNTHTLVPKLKLWIPIPTLIAIPN